MNELPEGVSEFDRQLNDHVDVKELRKQVGVDLKQLVLSVAALTTKIREVWPTIEGAEEVPALPLVVYQIAETLKQDMCVLVMDTLDPGWEDKAKHAMDDVLEMLKRLGEESSEDHPTIH